MVSSVGSIQMQQVYSSPSAKQSSQPAAASETPQDSVHLSAAAQKAIAGDADHDGDSH